MPLSLFESEFGGLGCMLRWQRIGESASARQSAAIERHPAPNIAVILGCVMPDSAW